MSHKKLLPLKTTADNDNIRKYYRLGKLSPLKFKHGGIE